MPTFKPKLFAAALCAALLLCACRNIDIAADSGIRLPEHFSQNQAAHGSADIAVWWRQWRDPVLDSLIERALAQNFDIRIAQSRLNEARAVAQLARADLGPTAGAAALAALGRGGSANPLDENLRQNLSRLPQAGALAEDGFSARGKMAGAGFAASWEPDIFGQKRSDADAARHAALGRQEAVYGARLLAAADTADHYFQARAAQGRLKTAADSVAVLEKMLRYLQGRFKAGHLTAAEVAQARSALASAQAKQSTIAAEYAAQVRAIAVLTGQVPQDFVLPDSSTDALAKQPDAPSGQTPQGLLERRPDLRAAAAEVRAYAAKLASTKADLLPRFSIRFLGQSGRIDLDSSDLKGWNSLVSVGIQLPLFTNGRISANIQAADARLQTALLRYDQTLLTALGEVDTAYQGQSALTRQNALLAGAARQSAQQAADSGKLFRHGSVTLDSALKAELAAQEARENLIRSQLARAQAALGLYKALGGGWSEWGSRTPIRNGSAFFATV